MQIRVENLTFGYAEDLFSDVNLTITENDKIAIVGNNGSGKSTLLKCISGELEPTSGNIVRPKGAKFAFIEQDVPERLMSMTLFDAIADAIPEEERDFSGWKVDVGLETLQAPTDYRDKKLSELSGGWQRLALVLRAWMSDPDALFLDEPTNHLDASKIVLLEKWLNEQVYGIPIVVISHDRQFLENCTNRTAFLRGGIINDYKHPYARARKLLLEDDKAAASDREAQLAEIARLDKSAHEQRQIGKNNFSDAALQKAKQIQRRADLLREQLTAVHVEERRDITLSNSGTHAKTLVSIQGLEVLSPAGNELFKIDKLEINQGDCIVVLGPNGSGKSVFLSYLQRAFQDPDKAAQNGIKITPTAQLAYIDQHLSHLPSDKSLADYFSYTFGLVDNRVTSVLANAGFPYDDQQIKIGKLSQGQRARVALLSLRMQEPNFYIMDEPTNHLDIAGQEQLESEILTHEAACVLVSHDRAFVENLGTRFFEIKNKKLVEIDSAQTFHAAMMGHDDSVLYQQSVP